MLKDQIRVARFSTGLVIAAGLLVGMSGQVALADFEGPLVVLDYSWSGGGPFQYVMHEDSDQHWYDDKHGAWNFLGGDNGAGWGLDWDVMATGPSFLTSGTQFVNADLTITNLTGTAQTFTALVTLVLPKQFVGGTLMSGGVSAAVSDNDSTGALLSNSGSNPIYSAFIDETPWSGSPVHTLWDTGFSLSAPPFGSNDDNEGFGTPNPLSGPEALNTISVFLQIELSAFDTARVIGTFEIQQQVPAPSALPLLAGLGLVLGGRRRRT